MKSENPLKIFFVVIHQLMLILLPKHKLSVEELLRADADVTDIPVHLLQSDGKISPHFGSLRIWKFCLNLLVFVIAVKTRNNFATTVKISLKV